MGTGRGAGDGQSCDLLGVSEAAETKEAPQRRYPATPSGPMENPPTFRSTESAPRMEFCMPLRS